MKRLDQTGSTGPRSWFWFWSHQWLGVAQDVVLEELVQHVEEVVLHQRLDDQLVLVMLQHAKHTSAAQRRAAGRYHSAAVTWTGIWNWFRERMYSISTAMTNL